MFDCSSDLLDFYTEHVRLPESTRATLRGHRQANQDRLRARLEEQGGPRPKSFVKQGSYAMRTMVRHPDNDYDIDDGVVFSKAELCDKDGRPLAASAAREMVCGALQDERFKKAPQVRENCVRVYYTEGHHVDIPVYREVSDEEEESFYELASAVWRWSDPNGVTRWFNDAVIAKSPDDSNGRQLRRVTCFFKQWARSRNTWDLPSGLILSVLSQDAYEADLGRDDRAFHNVLKTTHERLLKDLQVKHPLAEDMVTKTKNDRSMIDLRERLGECLQILEPLFSANCTYEEALGAWGKFFDHQFFQQRKEEQTHKAEKSSAATSHNRQMVMGNAGGLYGLGDYSGYPGRIIRFSYDLYVQPKHHMFCRNMHLKGVTTTYGIFAAPEAMLMRPSRSAAVILGSSELDQRTRDLIPKIYDEFVLKDRLVFLVILPGVDILPSLPDCCCRFVTIDLRQEQEQVLETLLNLLCRERGRPWTSPAR